MRDELKAQLRQMFDAGMPLTQQRVALVDALATDEELIEFDKTWAHSRDLGAALTEQDTAKAACASLLAGREELRARQRDQQQDVDQVQARANEMTRPYHAVLATTERL